jgi:drug/metabolite transporter (DMT)-like permease
MTEWKLVSEIIILAQNAKEEILKSEKNNNTNPSSTPPRETSQIGGFRCLTCSVVFSKPNKFDGNIEWNKLIKDSISFAVTGGSIAIGGSLGIVLIMFIAERLIHETSGSALAYCLLGFIVLVLTLVVIYYWIFYILKCLAAVIAAGVVRGTYPLIESRCPNCASQTISRIK